MAPIRSDQESAARSAALEAFRPEGFGFRRHRGRWVKDGDALGAIAVAPLSWQHVHAPSYEEIAGERVPCDALGFLVGLQARTWGMPPEELVPANLLAVLADTGGSALVAYDPSVGFNADGWLGFAIGLGARSGTLVSHMLGVREEARGTSDIGWHLKLLQGYEALRTGHAAACWTFDPMRGANARLNLEKLGAVVDWAKDGHEALALAEASFSGVRAAYDLVLIDIRMPGLDGHDTTRRIRQLEQALGRAQPVRVIPLTANALREDEKAARAAGLDGFLAKPFEIGSLTSLLGAASPPLARAS